MILLDAMPWYQIPIMLFGAAGLTTLVLFGLKWIRFRRTDSADINIKQATADKVKAEAEEIRSKADVNVADAALKLAERLTVECNKTREQLDKTEKDLDLAQNSLRDATIKMSEAQHDLKNERQKNIFMKYQIDELNLEIQRLKQLINGNTNQKAPDKEKDSKDNSKSS